MNDYYAGAEGARRLIKELDRFLQQVVDSVDSTELLTCAIKLKVRGGDAVSLRRIYRPLHAAELEADPALPLPEG